MIATTRTVKKYISMPGWRKVATKYCQIVSFDNRVKRYIHCCICKIYQETYDDVINIDECSVIIRVVGYKNYRKPSSDKKMLHFILIIYLNN